MFFRSKDFVILIKESNLHEAVFSDEEFQMWFYGCNHAATIGPCLLFMVIVLGMFIMQTIIVGLSYMGVGTSYQRIAIGAIIIVAVYWDGWRRSTR